VIKFAILLENLLSSERGEPLFDGRYCSATTKGFHKVYRVGHACLETLPVFLPLSLFPTASLLHPAGIAAVYNLNIQHTAGYS
jgi:hypothetical protein